ncbi:hypothetical protein KDW_63780 [Dictyobacter vulcani]|uniref:Uncharacterized protein n=1 Tax=Dictyobacter vulcani TaxID=2607529 RepID=A0A5J4L423_9CHLR|nr:hypothetical protein KDW_63780 [Dictyobacter vulcani]
MSAHTDNMTTDIHLSSKLNFTDLFKRKKRDPGRSLSRVSMFCPIAHANTFKQTFESYYVVFYLINYRPM